MTLPIVEHPARFACGEETLIGVLARPAAGCAPLGVIIVVGGPQYRAGSHRQFVLLARAFAAAGYPTLRFDYRGLGDSSGAPRSFEDIGDDVRAAIDYMFANERELRGAVLWGLCDAASAAMMYASSDRRIAGLALANPWARSPQTLAKTRLRHYYAQRLLSRAFWQKLLSGRFNPFRSAREIAGSVGQAMQNSTAHDFRDRMQRGVERFGGPILWIFSGDDLTAREFLAFAGERRLESLVASGRTRRLDLTDADHTFSTARWRDEVAAATIAWLAEVAPAQRAESSLSA